MPITVHLDADAFYVACEQAADQRLRGKLIAVGGTRRGIIASACYEARKLGVYTPMPSSQALKLCPDLQIVRPHFDRYEWFSQTMFAMVSELTSFLERTSIDEGYFVIPDSHLAELEGKVRELQQALASRLQLSVSFGIASNKLVSQIASKSCKPRGLVVVQRGMEEAFLAPLDVGVLPGVGNTTRQLLERHDIRWVRDIANASPSKLTALVGADTAQHLVQSAKGLDDRPLVLEGREAQSYGQQETLAEDETQGQRIGQLLRTQVDDLIRKVVAEHKSARTLAVRIRLGNREVRERSTSLSEPSNLADDFYPLIDTLLERVWDGRSAVRLVGVRLSNLHGSSPVGDLFTQADKVKRLALQQTMHDLQQRYGRQALQKGHAMEEEMRQPN